MAYILIVDDEPGVRRLLQEVLRLEGYLAQAVSTGAEAVQAVEWEPPAVALVDLRLRRPDGDNLPERLLALCPGLPLAVMTGLADHELEAKLKRLGVQAILRKPFDIDEVVLLVRQLLDRMLPVAAESSGNANGIPH